MVAASLAARFLAAWLWLLWTSPQDFAGAGGAPSGLDRVELERRFADGDGWAALPIYRDTSGAAHVPAPSGSRDSAVAWIPESPSLAIAGGLTLRLASVDRAGNRSEPSNQVVACAYVRDTLLVLLRESRTAAWHRGRLAAWSLSLEDTLPARVVHQEALQRDPRICELFGYRCLRGVREPCLLPAAPRSRIGH